MKFSIDRKRHILKALTWRVIASVTTFLLGWGLTGEISSGLKLGALDVVIKLVLYYLHERAWYKSKFGVHKDD